MKNRIYLFGIIAITIVMGFSMASCPDTDPVPPNPFEGTWSGFDQYVNRYRMVFTNSEWTTSMPDDPTFSMTGTYSYNGNTATLTGITSSTMEIPPGFLGSVFSIYGNTFNVSFSEISIVMTKGYNFVFIPPTTPTPLIINHWMDDSIDNVGDEKWYSFNVSSGITYRVWMNSEYQGDGTKTLSYIYVRAFDSDWIPISRYSNGWNTPLSITPSTDGTVYLIVNDGTNIYTGTFAIVYSTSSVRP